MRVLLAEDNPVNQKLASRLLQRLGAEVEVAVNGIEVLRALRDAHFDVVLMDCQMPQMDGYEATRQLRDPAGGARNPNIPVIALTAHALATDRVKCLAAGMNDYVTKPINPVQLQQALTKVLPEPDHRANRCDAAGTVLFDEAALLARTDNDAEFARELIALFIGSAGETLARLAAIVPSGDPETIRKLAHSLKGSAATAAAKALAASAANLERVAGTAQAAAALEALAAALEATIDEWNRLGWIPRHDLGEPPDADVASA
jgi:CheY-like chemotaxis protein/HPt (histidine-containing phosphotransfer) domain-containing protein